MYECVSACVSACVYVWVCVHWSHSTQAAASLHFIFLQHPVVLLLLLVYFIFARFSVPNLLLTSSVSLLIVHPLFLSSSAPLSEYGPHRLPISLVCRRLQRLLRLADPPGRGRRAAPSPSSSSPSSSSAAPERQSQRAATSAAAAPENQPCTGYPPLRAHQPCSNPSIRAAPLPLTRPRLLSKDSHVCCREAPERPSLAVTDH